MTLTSQEPVYVIGHLNPDTDAICAAVGYAEYLRVAEGKDAVGLGGGTIPSRVKWVLDQAEVGEPELVTDIRTTAGLISNQCTVNVSEGTLFLKYIMRCRRAEWNRYRWSLTMVKSVGY